MVLNRKHLLDRRSFLAVLGATVAPTMLGSGMHRRGGASGEVWVEREAYLMGTRLRGQIAAPTSSAGIAAMERTFLKVRQVEELLSSWMPDSAIAHVNTSATGEPVRVAPELLRILAEVEPWVGATGGAFDPAVGPLVDAWDLRGEGRKPAHAELNAAVRESGWTGFTLNVAEGTVVRSRRAWIDSGGFGKGVAMRAAEQVLRRSGVRAGLLDFGGQILALGAPAESSAWPVMVAHPERRTEAAATLRLRDRSVATTAQSERFVEVGGKRFGHVLDPRSGHPVPAWGSVTVVSHDALLADVLSTALFVMGPEAGRRWVEEREEGVLFLEVRGGEVEASWNEAFEQYRVNQRTREAC